MWRHLSSSQSRRLVQPCLSRFAEPSVLRPPPSQFPVLSPRLLNGSGCLIEASKPSPIHQQIWGPPVRAPGVCSNSSVSCQLTANQPSSTLPFELQVVFKSGYARKYAADANHMSKGFLGAVVLAGTSGLFRGQRTRQCVMSFQSPFQFTDINGVNNTIPCFARSFASKASESRGQNTSESRKDISTVEDPFDAPTYNIPEKPVTFTEGASYTVIILAGLGVAAAAGYAVFKELIFEPKEYKIFGKALKRIQNDSQVRARIGSPITGYGQESRNRAARQRIANRTWTDEDGIEHVEVNFYIRGPHGAGKVYTEMFKDKVDNQWKFTHLIVEIKSPSPVLLTLESYLPA